MIAAPAIAADFLYETSPVRVHFRRKYMALNKDVALSHPQVDLLLKESAEFKIQEEVEARGVLSTLLRWRPHFAWHRYSDVIAFLSGEAYFRKSKQGNFESLQIRDSEFSITEESSMCEQIRDPSLDIDLLVQSARFVDLVVDKILVEDPDFALGIDKIIEGLEWAEIAERHGITEDAAKARWQRSKTRNRPFIEKWLRD